EGRGYVLRRIIRRAGRHGHHLGVTGSFLHRLVSPLIEQLGEADPGLVAAQARVDEVLLAEEVQFSRPLAKTRGIRDQAISELKGSELPGDTVFRLYDTYGFPVDLTADIARERELTLDMPGFDVAMSEQKAKARSASRFESDVALDLDGTGETRFDGYDATTSEARILALFAKGEKVDSLAAGESGVVVLDNTA